MSHFSECYLLVFGQLAVGGVAGLAVPPFAILERGFYKSSAGVFLGCALLFLAGRITLAARAQDLDAGVVVEIALWMLFSTALAVYTATLWGDRPARRATTYPIALAAGVVALSASAAGYRLGPALGPGTLLYPVAFLVSALALGGVAVGMLLGHWYLIDLGLSIEPLRRLFRYFVAVLVLQVVVMAVTVGLLWVASDAGSDAVRLLVSEHGRLLAARLVLGPVAALGLGYLIHRTLAIPQTMAATGLFYVAILAVMVGELLGRLILFRTSLPL